MELSFRGRPWLVNSLWSSLDGQWCRWCPRWSIGAGHQVAGQWSALVTAYRLLTLDHRPLPSRRFERRASTGASLKTIIALLAFAALGVAQAAFGQTVVFE